MASEYKSFWLRPNGLAALGLIGAASYFLLIEHRQHLFQWLPFLIFALCPLMHIFMHGGHGDHSDHPHAADDKGEAYRQGFKNGGNNSDQDHRR